MQRQTKLLGIVPARAGSKRVPGKNMKRLAGRPLIEYAVAAALAAKRLSKVVVTSDSDALLAHLGQQSHDGLTLIRRPDELATDTALAIDYVRHALSLETEEYDGTVIIQPTSPFTISADIDGTIALWEQSDAKSAASVMRIPHDLNPLKLKVFSGDRLLPYFEAEGGRTSAHQVPDVFVRNGSVYVSSMAAIEEGQVIHDDAVGYLMPRERSLDINDPVDFAFAEFFHARMHD